MSADIAENSIISFKLDSFESPTSVVEISKISRSTLKDDVIIKLSTLEDALDVVEDHLLDRKSSTDITLASTHTSQMKKPSVTVREQEVASEACTAMLFGRNNRNRLSPSAISKSPQVKPISPTSPYLDISQAIESHQVSHRRASTTALPRRAPYHSSNPKKQLFRYSSDIATLMRRESIAEKLDMEMNLSRCSSPIEAAGVHRKTINSPTSSMLSRRDKSHWSPDNSDTEESHPSPLEYNEAEAEEETEDLAPAIISTARRVSRSFERSNSMTLNQFSSTTFPSSPLSPTFPNMNNSKNIAAAALSPNQSRRGSRLLVRATDEEEPGTKSQELVRLIESLQSAHLEETRRLNDLITKLSEKVASLETQVTRQRGECQDKQYHLVGSDSGGNRVGTTCGRQGRLQRVDVSRPRTVSMVVPGQSVNRPDHSLLGCTKF